MTLNLVVYKQLKYNRRNRATTVRERVLSRHDLFADGWVGRTAIESVGKLGL